MSTRKTPGVKGGWNNKGDDLTTFIMPKVEKIREP
jgi:hypothetical protein